MRLQHLYLDFCALTVVFISDLLQWNIVIVWNVHSLNHNYLVTRFRCLPRTHFALQLTCCNLAVACAFIGTLSRVYMDVCNCARISELYAGHHSISNCWHLHMDLRILIGANRIFARQTKTSTHTYTHTHMYAIMW